jgi:Kef-type K+ transport system membrane component KefB/nucleotide-binding universal stress UspA family protein
VDLPTSNPVLIVAISMVMFLVAPLLSQRLKLPSLIGLIIAGALVGPNALGLLARDNTIELLGTVGLLYLMFVAGLELDLVGFKRYRRRSLVFGLLSFSLPLVLALLVMSVYGFSLAAALLVGAIVASHTLLAYPIASRLGITKNAAVTTVMGGTLLTDTLSLGVLAAIDGAAGGEGGLGFWLRLVGALVLYAGVLFLGLPRLGRWFFRHTDSEASIRFLFLMAVLFTSAYAAELAGAQPIIGAFLAGLVLNAQIPEQSTLMTRIRFVGNAVFIPFFLFSVGMLVDVRVIFGGPTVVLLAALLIGLVFVGKGGAALLSQRVFGFSRTQGLLMVGLSVPQAAATLAVTFVGLEIGLFDTSVVNAVIVLILVSCLVGSTLVERFGRALAVAEEKETTVPSEAPHRILIPLANPATAEALLDVALLVREKGSPEPLFPLTVVPDDERALDHVAGAERMLAHAVVQAAEAEIPATPMTRVAHNRASGIVRAATERRATDIIIGWNGQRSAPRAIFGSVIDQLLEQTDQQVMVCKLDHPVGTLKRVLVVLPPLIDYNPGFYGAVRTLKRLTQQLGAELLVLAVQGDTERFQARFEEVEPEVEISYQGITSWPALRRTLREERLQDDLVVVMSARRGTAAYSSLLERLPGELSGLAASFIVLYPSEQELESTRGAAGVHTLLSEERVLFSLGTLRYDEAIEKLLETVPLNPPFTAPRPKVLRMLTQDDVGYASEVLPGVLISHARVQGLKEPLMCLGLSRRGVSHYASSHVVHVIVLLLSPLDLPAQEHLARLAEVTEQLAQSGRISELVSSRSMPELRAWFERSKDPPPQERALASHAH